MDETPTHLDLFSGIGGFALAAWKAGFRTIGFCEIDKYCQKVLAKNFLADAGDGIKLRESSTELDVEQDALHRRERSQTSDGFRADCPTIRGNIFDLDGTQFRGVSLITGGFPCQPFSVAGKRRGAADDRHLWPEMLRVINEARPAWVLGENVPGIIPMELDNVLSDLERIGYACRPFVIPACAVDARHRRNRLWIIANSKHDGLSATEPRSGTERTEGWENQLQQFTGSSGVQDVHNSAEPGCEKCATGLDGLRNTSSTNGEGVWRWLPEPDVGRVAHGIPSRVDRLRGLGNAIVPQVAYEILREIRKLI